MDPNTAKEKPGTEPTGPESSAGSGLAPRSRDPEVKPADITSWALLPDVWTFPHDRILEGKGPNRERVRDSLGNVLDGSGCCEVAFEIDPATVTLPEIELSRMSYLQVKGCVCALMWIPDASGRGTPRHACLIELVRCHVSARQITSGLGIVFESLDNLNNAAIWLIYDTQTRTGRVLRIDH